jgi:predicted lipoprotein with Yx(FWY)xxD motif
VVVAAAGFAAVGATACASSRTTTIGSRDTKVGVILVGPRGQTLYLFSHGPPGPSGCYGRCARNWPPLRAFGRPVAMPGSGVKQRWLSTTRRRDGILQVTYDGHPLYVNGGDTKPGRLKGDHTQEFGGRWYVVPISGVKARPV